ncbi:hypothetical protein Cgig2_011670 [Carnegiea gigantea]|uniref:Uncharacterized protein n=1 Tax=Carnegiea gigantea TaxID=171969 RepID=A0A9Q1Q8E0_9CARY|nr:hypothetical protein Cgig2_011670 [Carnegiea gigantea]
MIVTVDDPMIGRFIEDLEAFHRYADDRLDLIEQNRNQKAKSDEFTALDSEDCDENRSKVVDREKFRVELRAVMATVAEDLEAFNRYADEKLDLIEQNHTQKAKSDEFMALDSEYYDENRSEVVDREKFRVELRAVMAEAIGKMRVNVVVEEGSLMMKVYQGEGKRIEKEKEEKMKKIEMIIRKSGDDQEGEREINSEIVGPKKVKKKRSMEFLNCCACFGKYYAENS